MMQLIRVKARAQARVKFSLDAFLEGPVDACLIRRINGYCSVYAFRFVIAEEV